jgi:hypothetical protein
MAISSGHSREERIRRELNRLKRLLKELPKDQVAAADGLLKRISFMAITLEDMEEDINANGEVEAFTQGGSTYDRQRPAVQIYNTTIKNYTMACKQLLDLIPNGPPKKTETDDPFMRIMGRKKNG